jgi:hypothetical protein
MGEAIRNFFHSVGELLTFTTPAPRAGGYPVDYSAVSDADIAAEAPCAETFKTGNWTSVNRKS